MNRLRFRQVHLDAHTSEFIPGVGSGFDKRQWQETLQRAMVDSITCFSCCHHGWSYHPTAVGCRHPQLTTNLLRLQMDACHEIGVNVPIYLTAGLNNYAAAQHPEWREITADGQYAGWASGPLQPGFHKMCFNTPYLDYLVRLIEEAVTMFPDADGVFLDIIHQGECCCPKCMADMLAGGYDPSDPSDRRLFAAGILERYFARSTAAARSRNSQMPIFHNSGHVSPAWLPKLRYFSHLELESLPTGGWGYDHFPQTAAFAALTGMDYLGMTGKFHSSWGEFGGFKHPNALRYECGAMLAVGARCSIGDQLHPTARLNESTYELIGAAYREVAAKEPWCADSQKCSEVGVLTLEGFSDSIRALNAPGDIGAGRLLLEAQLQFDILAPSMNFDGYRLLILPDEIPVDETLRARLNSYLARGGKLLLSGDSVLREDGNGFWLDIGAKDGGPGEFNPTYLWPEQALQPDFCHEPFVVYGAARQLHLTDGEELSRIVEPYFNRDYRHFSSHQHTPNRLEASGLSGAVRKGNVVYLAHKLFGIYRQVGAVTIRQHLTKVVRQLLGEALLETSLPSLGRATLRRQPAENRLIVHLLYADRAIRGGSAPDNPCFADPVEVIEELLPVFGIDCSVAVGGPVRAVRLVPEKRELPFECSAGRCRFTVPKILGHQMIAIELG